MTRSETWRKNVRSCHSIIQQNLGPKVVNVVSGSEADRQYWQERLAETRQDVFRGDGETLILSSLEKTRKGNFLGSINAWMEIQRDIDQRILPPVMLMNMVFGQGKRLSPFTQALGNRKPAFPTPMRSSGDKLYLSTADAAAMSATLWLHHLESNGFRGFIIKWGDEAVFPGKTWKVGEKNYREVDGVRFVWETEPTEELAREKEWVEFDDQSSQMTFQYTRQGLDSLRHRLSQRGQGRRIGVNLGSLGISYSLMQVAAEVFGEDISDENKWVDWDPYTWIALVCRDEDEWKAEAAFEERGGKSGIQDLEKRVPDFYGKIQQMRKLFLRRHGRLPVISALDFGQPYWMDWGLHLSLRQSLEAMTTDSELGVTSRELFELPHERDKNRNILLRSSIPPQADIHDSLLVDTVITDRQSVIHGGLVVAGRHRRLEMPDGGSVLFCAADWMNLAGPHAIGFKLTGERYELGEGDRLANLYLADGKLVMRSNESLVNYEGENYTVPMMGNPLSFEEAARRISVEDNRLVEKRWLDWWSRWLE